MPPLEKHEGLVLKAIDFKDRQKIITLYTPTRGLLSLIVKGINRKKSHLLTLTSPFTRGEYHIQIGRSQLYTFLDGTPLTTHHDLRRTLPHLNAATTLAKALLNSQLPEKPSPALYLLTLSYLKNLPLFPNPSALTASYHLKLLGHDGHLNPELPESPFTADEWKGLLPLLNVRSIPALRDQSITPKLLIKVETYFQKKMDLRS